MLTRHGYGLETMMSIWMALCRNNQTHGRRPRRIVRIDVQLYFPDKGYSDKEKIYIPTYCRHFALLQKAYTPEIEQAIVLTGNHLVNRIHAGYHDTAFSHRLERTTNKAWFGQPPDVRGGEGGLLEFIGTVIKCQFLHSIRR